MDQETMDEGNMNGEEKEPLMGAPNLDSAKGWLSRPDVAFHVIGIFLMTCSAAFYALMMLQAPSDMECAQLNWAWSPLMEGFKFQWRRFDSDRVPATYMESPTLERREAWRSLSQNGWIEFPRSRLPVVDKQDAGHEWIGPPPPKQDQLIAEPEVVHQVHCVAEMYDFLHRADWDYSDHYASELIFKLHANHCFYTVMNLVTCNADITPVLFQKADDGQGAWKTVDAPHLCKDWEALGRWHAEHKVCQVNCYPEDMQPDVYFQHKQVDS